MTFAEQVAKFAQRTERRLAKTVSGAATKLASNIVMGTPIDLPFGMHDPGSIGRARGGWVAGFDTNLTSNNTPLDPNGAPTVQKIAQTYSLYSPRIQTTLYLVNTVGYIGKLEFGFYRFADELRVKTLPSGFSIQAPAGMMRVNAKEWGTTVSNAARVSRTVR